MLKLIPNPPTALDLLADELASWSRQELHAACQLQREACHPTVRLPAPPHMVPGAKVLSLTPRLRKRSVARRPIMQSRAFLQVA